MWSPHQQEDWNPPLSHQQLAPQLMVLLKDGQFVEFIQVCMRL